MHKYEKNGKINNMSLEEKNINSTKIFEGVFLNLYKDDVITADNQKALENILSTRALLQYYRFERRKLLIERQWRFPIKQEIFEFPAGKIDIGESPLATAKGLLEETGILRRAGVNWESCSRSSLFQRKNISFLRKDLNPECEQNRTWRMINLVDTVEEFLAKCKI